MWFHVEMDFRAELDSGEVADALFEVVETLPGGRGTVTMTVGGPHEWNEDVTECVLCSADVFADRNCPVATREMNEREDRM